MGEVAEGDLEGLEDEEYEAVFGVFVRKVRDGNFPDLHEADDAAGGEEDGGEDVQGRVRGEPVRPAEESCEEDGEGIEDEESNSAQYSVDDQRDPNAAGNTSKNSRERTWSCWLRLAVSSEMDPGLMLQLA